MHNFLSGNSNKRTDEYGGSLENHMRFPLEVAKAVCAAWPEHRPLFVRVSGSDFAVPGTLGHDPDRWDVWQTIGFSKALKAFQIDLVGCLSGGNLPNVQYPVGPMYQVVFAEAVRKHVASALVLSASSLTQGHRGCIVERASRSGAHCTGVRARQCMAWVGYAAQQLNVDVRWPNQYIQAAGARRI